MIKGNLLKTERLMNFENLKRFTYVNDAICKKPVKCIVISFFRLGESHMYDYDFPEGRVLREND